MIMLTRKCPEVASHVARAQSAVPFVGKYFGARTADTYVGSKRHATHTLASAGAMPDAPGSREAAKNGPVREGQPASVLTDFAPQFADMRRQGEHFRAFALLEAVKREGDAVAALPAGAFKTTWQQLVNLSLDSDVGKAMSTWMADVALKRVEDLGGYSHLPDSDDKIAALREAIASAAQAARLREATHPDDPTAPAFWQKLERAATNSFTATWKNVSAEAMPAVFAEQAGLLTKPFELAGHPAQHLVQRLVEALADRLKEQALVAMPWICAVAARYGVDETFVMEHFMWRAGRPYYRSLLLKQPLEMFPVALAHRLTTAVAESLIEEGQEMDTSTINGLRSGYHYSYDSHTNCFPLLALDVLPELATRLRLSPESRQGLAQAVEAAAEAMAKNVRADHLSRPLRENHAAWVFASGLRREVRSAEHLELVARGLQDPEGTYGWRWDLPFSQRAEVFALLAAAARDAGLSDQLVRQAWDVAQEKALKRALARAEHAEKVRSRAATDAAAAEVHSKSANEDAAQTAQAVLGAQSASVDW